MSALAAWGALALWFDGPASRPAAALLAVAFLVGVALPPLRFASWRTAIAASGAACTVVLGWWLTLPPSNDRAWLRDVARTPASERQGRVVTLHDVRHFAYRSETDFSERWETRRYDLDAVAGLDLFVCFWGPTLYAHTILSFQFEGAEPLAVSIETRKEQGESYSAVRGFFRQYELVYVMADERDVVGLRARFRGERVRLYRLATPAPQARALLERYLAEANSLARQPAWYNAFTQNCTTGIWRNVHAIAPRNRFDWRLLANGYLDELLYERGALDTRLPLGELRARSDVSERIKALRRARRLLGLHPRGAAAARVARDHTPGRHRHADWILTSARLQTASKRFSTEAASARFFCSCERPREAVEPPAVVGQLLEVLAEDGLGLGEAARREQRRAERVAHRLDPVGRLVVAELVLARGGLAQQRDALVALPAAERELARSTRSATSSTSLPLLLPKVASFGTFVRASRNACSSCSESLNAVRGGEGDAARVVLQRARDRHEVGERGLRQDLVPAAEAHQHLERHRHEAVGERVRAEELERDVAAPSRGSCCSARALWPDIIAA